MNFQLPEDIDFAQVFAVSFLFFAWFFYSYFLKVISRGSLNEQLSTVRSHWLFTSVNRPQKPFDAILLGNIVNSISFFGSATMIVLAGLITLFASARPVYDIVLALPFDHKQSYELFVFQIAVLNTTLAVAFFSFTYALRKLIYVLALVGAFPPGELDGENSENLKEMVESTSVVLTEALKTFNFGIRGYYYFIAALGLIISPILCVCLTIFMTAILIYRQLGTTTAKAINRYVEASNALNKERM